MNSDLVSRIETCLKSFSNKHDGSISSKLLREAVEELKRVEKASDKIVVERLLAGVSKNIMKTIKCDVCQEEGKVPIKDGHPLNWFVLNRDEVTLHICSVECLAKYVKRQEEYFSYLASK